MKKVYFVRHGEAEHNLAKEYSDEDSMLTAVGRQQALQAAQEVKQLDDTIDLIISSPMLRALETAEIIAGELLFPLERIEKDERLWELRLGGFVGEKDTPENRQKRNEHFLTRDNEMGIEWIGDLAARTAAFVLDAHNRPEDVVLVVGHNATGRMLRRIFGGLDHTASLHRLRNAEIVQLHPYSEAESDAEKIL